MQGAPQEPGRGPGNALVGFLLMSFAVVGLTGLLAAHVAPLPLERAITREAVLDEALAAGRAGDAAALEALRTRLGDSAQALLPARGASPAAVPAAEFEARVAAERLAMRARRLAESEATATRLRGLLILVTLLGAAFGTAMMLAGRRVAPRDKMG